MNNTELNNEKHFRYKLNMLEPGIMMIRMIGVFAAMALLFWAVEWNILCIAALATAGIILLVLLFLIVIEAYQDNVLDKILIVDNDDQEEEFIKIR